MNQLVYKSRRARGICVICGMPAKQRYDGSHYAKCPDCFERERIKAQRRAKNQKSKHTLCWTCAHAVPNPAKGHGCEWSINKLPVPGWEAERTEIKLFEDQSTKSYHIKKCPKYEKEKR